MTNEDRILGKEILSRVATRYHKHQVADVLRRSINAFELEGDMESVRIMRLALEVYEEEETEEQVTESDGFVLPFEGGKPV